MAEVSVKELGDRIEAWKRDYYKSADEVKRLTEERDHYKHLSEVYHRLLVRLGEHDGNN